MVYAGLVHWITKTIDHRLGEDVVEFITVSERDQFTTDILKGIHWDQGRIIMKFQDHANPVGQVGLTIYDKFITVVTKSRHD